MFIRRGETGLLIDTSTDLRLQAMTHGVDRVDAVLYTHAHADHVHGIDELRSFNWLQQGPIPCYGNRATIAQLKARFGYVFSNGAGPGYKPQLIPHELDGAREIGGVLVEPIDIVHGEDRIYGYRIGAMAYVTDCSAIPDASRARLRGLDLLIVSAIRYDAHPTHFTLAQALAAVEDLKPRRAVLTHLSHVFDYETVNRELPAGVELAYDGMVLSA
ncbi:MAG: MBL fold metallo-hydrolase [Nitrospirae bacterium]|nr:MBL fold metallo-hydrolase [Nitrospirota bacterium]